MSRFGSVIGLVTTTGEPSRCKLLQRQATEGPLDPFSDQSSELIMQIYVAVYDSVEYAERDWVQAFVTRSEIISVSARQPNT